MEIGFPLKMFEAQGWRLIFTWASPEMWRTLEPFPVGRGVFVHLKNVNTGKLWVLERVVERKNNKILVTWVTSGEKS